MQLNANLELDRYEWAEQCLAELLPACSNRQVADVGCTGISMRQPTLTYGGNWFGFDVAPKHELVEQWNIDAPFEGESDSFGVVLLLDVIEHLKNPWRGIRHIAEICAEGSFLVMTTPNPRWSRSRLNALRTGYPACFTQSDLNLNHHVFTPWPHIIAQLLVDNGFVVKRYVTLDGKQEWPDKPFNLRYPLRSAIAAVNMLIERLDATACGMSYGIIAKKT